MAKQELGPNQLKWIEALDSGDYSQSIGALRKEIAQVLRDNPESYFKETK
jgi:hypothetical protein